MRLWILDRLVDTDKYDVTLGVVVRATTEEKARKLAHEAEGPHTYPKDLWLNPKNSSCEVLSARGKSEVIITDFKAG
jgi:hypothetical protein